MVQYQNTGTPGETRATAGKLAKASFLGRDPTGERPIPSSLWENGELTEKGTLMKDVQDTVWNYLRVHLTRILHRDVLARVQAQEDMYHNFPDLKDGPGYTTGACRGANTSKLSPTYYRAIRGCTSWLRYSPWRGKTRRARSPGYNACTRVNSAFTNA